MRSRPWQPVGDPHAIRVRVSVGVRLRLRLRVRPWQPVGDPGAHAQSSFSSWSSQ